MFITRRRLVKATVAMGAGLALGRFTGLTRALATGGEGLAVPVRPDPNTGPSVLYDVSLCIGCHLCQVACQVNKQLPKETALITFKEFGAPIAAGVTAVRRHQCMHCLSPACASACPVAALYKSDAGPVVYRDDRCIGCRYCMSACPFGVPTFDWDRGLLDGAFIHKCDFCADRLAAGRQPVCVEACPTGAVIFGRREDMLAEARGRIQAHPDRYIDEIYGEHEVGGTSFLMISGIPFAELGMPRLDSEPLPELSEQVMGATIPFALGWATVLSAVTGLVRLRERGRQRREEQRSQSGDGNGKG